MKTQTIGALDRVYECAARYTVQRHRVRYYELGQFCVGLNSFRNCIGEFATDPYWQKFLSYLRHFQFELCAAPFSYDYRDHRIREIHNDLSNHLKHCGAIYPDFVHSASQLLGLLNGLCGDCKNPLLDKLMELSQPEQHIAWVIKESRLISHVDDVINAHPRALRHVVAIHHSQMSASDCFDAVIVIGSPRWFPASVFTSPRAHEIHVVQYSWICDSWKLPETFVAQYTPARSKRVAISEDNVTDEMEIHAENLLLTVDNEAIVACTNRDGHHEYDEIEARCVVLEGEQALFVEADDSTSVLVIDLDEEEDERVKTIAVRELSLGTFILVRTGGGGDYIVPIADQIMGGDARLARQRQHEWKHRLKEYVIAHGLLKTSIDLLNMGSGIANEMNVRNWIFPRNIKTRSKTDFLAIMQLVGLEDQAADYWKTMDSISSAHRKAGFQLRKMLLDQVSSIAPDEFRRRGQIEFRFSESDDDAGLTAFRVEDILYETFRVSFSRIGVPFRLGG